MGDLIYLDNYLPFDPYDEPCSKCPPAIKDSCCTTCEEAVRHFTKVAELLKGKNVE